MARRRTRRQFLEDSMFAAAAAVANGTAVPLLGDDAVVQSKSPNEKLGVAVIGVRGRGNSHISEFAGRRDTEILYICDTDADVGLQRVQEVAKRQSGRRPRFAVDLREVLDDKSIDLVSIATPHHWHALAAIWAMQAGKDVYLEKPVSHNVSEGRRLVDAARKYQRICQSGMQCRSNAGMRKAIQYVRGGNIGDVSVARGLCYKPRPAIGQKGDYAVPHSVDYELWLGPAPSASLVRPRFHYDWHWQWAYGNGDLGNQGIHQMDIARWGLGADQLSEAVISFGGRFGYQDAAETPNTQVVIHRYGTKTLILEVRGLRSDSFRGARIGVIFEGTEGYVVMSSYSDGAAFDLAGNKVREFSGGGNHFENFLRAVRSRKFEELHADVEEGHLSSALCHLGNISYLLGQPLPMLETTEYFEQLDIGPLARESLERVVQHLLDNNVDLPQAPIRLGPLLVFDPHRECFVGHEQASQLLSREYRRGYEVPGSAGQV